MEKEPQKDEAFEAQKRQAEEQRKRETLEDLKSKLLEIINENPIEIKYCGYGNSKDLKFNKIDSISINDKYCREIGIKFINDDKFNKDNYFYVGDSGVRTSLPFEKKYPEYKITEISFQNILTMMNKLIDRSDLNDLEKNKMFQYVVDNFKDKILKTEEIEKKN